MWLSYSHEAHAHHGNQAYIVLTALENGKTEELKQMMRVRSTVRFLFWTRTGLKSGDKRTTRSHAFMTVSMNIGPLIHATTVNGR
jgi:hypothetical protein